jgi:hypothetical protein
MKPYVKAVCLSYLVTFARIEIAHQVFFRSSTDLSGEVDKVNGRRNIVCQKLFAFTLPSDYTGFI